MSPTGTPRQDRPKWPIIGFMLLLCAAGGIVAYRTWPRPTPVAASVSSPAISKPVPAPAGPSFDVVRIDPQGQAVIAGRATSGAEVTVRDGNRVLGQTRADAQGQFVLLPDAALPPGGRELTLSARAPDGTEIAGADSVFLLVPTPAETAAPSIAVLLSHDAAPPRLLTGVAPRSRKLGLDTVDYDEGGDIRFAGSAKPDMPIRLYVDNRPIGDATADHAGQWTLKPDGPVAPGIHQLRVDQLGPDGRVVGRIELPFQRTATIDRAFDHDQARAIVQPGQNLWRIARQSYGQGTRFTLIYLANRDQIRDPSRIYPGQVFAVPPRS